MSAAAKDAREHLRSAAEWDARLRSPDCTAADRAAFEDWLAEDSANGARHAALQARLQLLKSAAQRSPELVAVRARALQAGRERRRPWVIAGAAAIAATLALAVGLGLQPRTPAPAPSAIAVVPAPGRVFQTGPGERLTVRLEDGSQLTLNARTEIELAFSADRRRVVLVEGEALFDVAKDAARPFAVETLGRTVTAVGTSFTVRADPALFKVTMVEGRTTVGMTPGGRLIPLVAGQRLAATPGSAAVRVETADLSKETAWIDGRVIFDDEPLDRALAEMNRYLRSPLILGDASLEDIRVNGMFRTDRPDAFVSALSDLYDVEVVADADGRGGALVRRDGAAPKRTPDA